VDPLDDDLLLFAPRPEENVVHALIDQLRLSL
jgi:hypothetical protein